MKVKSIPQPGDVLFFNSFDLETIVSGIAQTKIDPDANEATRTFGHVAIVISNLLALEAVPSDPDDMQSRIATLRDTTAIGKWTGSELRGGVRLIPIADLVVPIMHDEFEFVALRTLDVGDELVSNFTPFHRDVLPMLGSQYSIELLRQKTEARIPKALHRYLKSKFDWSSIPNDLATRIDIDPDLRTRIEKSLPDFSLPDAARTFFCSQAVIRCLRLSGIMPSDWGTDLVTPTGLYRLLVDHKWVDVSVLYRCAPDAKAFQNMSPMTHSASYTSTLAMTDLAIKQNAIALGAGLIDSSVEALSRLCEEVTKKLP